MRYILLYYANGFEGDQAMSGRMCRGARNPLEAQRLKRRMGPYFEGFAWGAPILNLP